MIELILLLLATMLIALMCYWVYECEQVLKGDSFYEVENENHSHL